MYLDSECTTVHGGYCSINPFFVFGAVSWMRKPWCWLPPHFLSILCCSRTPPILELFWNEAAQLQYRRKRLSIGIMLASRISKRHDFRTKNVNNTYSMRLLDGFVWGNKSANHAKKRKEISRFASAHQMKLTIWRLGDSFCGQQFYEVILYPCFVCFGS